MPPGAVIAVSPIGDVSPEHVRAARAEIEQLFGYSTETVRLLDDLSFAYSDERRQYHSTLILDKLARLSPRRVIKVLGIARVDLYIPILTHVFGEAQLGGTACVISTCRLEEGPTLPPDAASLTARIVKEAVHELGHTFKLRHCREKTCIMHYCRSVADVDRKSRHFCRYCSVLVEDEQRRLAKGPDRAVSIF